MRPIHAISLLILVCAGFKPAQSQFAPLNDCTRNRITNAWYEKGQFLRNLPSGTTGNFEISFATPAGAPAFVSDYEKYLRMQAIAPDTSINNLTVPGWNVFTPAQKASWAEQHKIISQQKADSAHNATSKWQQVWINNQSAQTYYLQAQDGSFMGILEAQDPKGQWHPVEYWRFSGCGNSYHSIAFAPGTACSFVVKPTAGSLPASLRYKLMGCDRFYYSTEFKGNIDPVVFEKAFVSELYTGQGYKNWSLMDTVVQRCRMDLNLKI